MKSVKGVGRGRGASRVLFVGLLLLSTLAACGGSNPTAGSSSGEPAAGGKLRVIATFSILGDLVRHVGGDLGALTTFVPPGADAHTFEPSPADSVALAEAAVVVENGVGFEPWLPDLLTASGSRAARIEVSRGIGLLQAGEAGELDPHVWQDAGNTMRMVENIRDGLVQADPANAAAYRTNAETYLRELKELDAFVVERVAALPPERRKLVTTHDTFGYFARRYGFEIVGTAVGVSTEAADPSAATIAALVEQIKAAGVPAIFTESMTSGSLMERVAREAGVVVAPTLYTDSLGAAGSPGDSYVSMMRYNVETIVTALAQ